VKSVRSSGHWGESVPTHAVGWAVASLGASSLPISSRSSSRVSNPRSPPRASAIVAKISQSGREIPAGLRTGRIRCPRPSQSVKCPSLSMSAAAGRKASANGSRLPSSSDWTTLYGTLSSARRASFA